MKESPLLKWYIVPIMVLIWVLSLSYASGIGIAYNVYGMAQFLVLGLTAYHIIISENFAVISKKLLAFCCFFVLVSLYTYFKYGASMWEYVWLYLLVPLIALLPVEEKQMRYVSLIYGCLGMAVLFLVNYGGIFSGWNPNSLAMVAFFSFAVMIMAFNNVKKPIVFVGLGLYFILYYQWTGVLNSRSSVLFTIIMLLCVVGVIPMQKWLKSSRLLLILLLVPLILAVFLAYIISAETTARLDAWSLEKFEKTIFNGRDYFARWGFAVFWERPFFGSGNLSMANWHNSSITMLTGGGIVGYVIWIYANYFILKRGIPYLDDFIVRGLMIGFLAIWLQQSVELGIVANKANAIPYAMLGLLWGRIRTLQKERANADNQIVDYCTRI